MSKTISQNVETIHGIVQYTPMWKQSNDTEPIIAWMQACVLFAHIFIGIEDISFIEQIPQTLDLSAYAINICN